jgi:taurine dioxygenase
MRTTVLASDFAVRIEGVDLSKPLDDGTLDAVKRTWMDYKVAVFPGQTLEDADLLGFAGRLGPVFKHVQSTLHSEEYGQVMYMSSKAQKALVQGELDWHTDQSYTPKPVFGTILYGIEIPDSGGETCFADLAAAWRDLPDRLRPRVEGQTAVYSAEKPGHARRIPLTDAERAKIRDVVHPLVRTHPHLGRKALYLSPNHIKSIGDLPQEESDALLSELTAHAAAPSRVYVHEWTPGDVIMWDNTSVMHRRNHFDPGARRFHKRTGFYLPDELSVPF